MFDLSREVYKGTVTAGVITWLDLNVWQGFEASPLPLLSLWNGPEVEVDEEDEDEKPEADTAEVHGVKSTLALRTDRVLPIDKILHTETKYNFTRVHRKTIQRKK